METHTVKYESSSTTLVGFMVVVAIVAFFSLALGVGIGWVMR